MPGVKNIHPLVIIPDVVLMAPRPHAWTCSGSRPIYSVQQVDILPFFRSDHSYVFLRITLPNMPDRGPGVWKFNTSLLDDDVFDARIRDFWHSWKDQRDSFPFLDMWLDAGKDRLKKIMQRYLCEKACSRRACISSLENTLYHLNRRANTGDDVSQFIKKETKTYTSC